MLKNLTEFGDLLRVQRITLKLKSKEVADKVGISAAAYSKIELGQVHPTDILCQRLSEVLDIPVQKLYILSGIVPNDILSELNNLYLHFGDSAIVVIQQIINNNANNNRDE